MPFGAEGGNVKESEYSYQGEITCPFCGYRDPNSWESRMGNDDEEEIECKRCGKPFAVSCSVSRTFTSHFIGAVAVQDEVFPRGA